MNKIGIVLLMMFAFAACNSTQDKTADTSKNEINSEVAVKNVSENMAKPGNEATGGKVVYLTTESFKQKVFNYEVNKEWKYEGTTPCIVDFYADWCGPCKRIAPILDELAKEYDGEIIIYKVDTEKNRELSAAFGIRSIPSILFVPASGQPQMAQGALPKETFVNAIEEVLLEKKSS